MMVGRDFIRAALTTVQAPQELGMPTTVGEVRAFLGLAGFLGGFVPDISTIVSPISNLLRDKTLIRARLVIGLCPGDRRKRPPSSKSFWL